MLFGQADLVGQNRHGRIAEHLMVGRDDDGQFVGSHAETFEKALGVGVMLGVEQSMRIAVAHQKALEPQRIAAMTRPDQDRAATGMADDADASQNEGAHDDLADIGFAAHHAAERDRIEPGQTGRHGGFAADQDASRVEQVEFAAELTIPMGGENPLLPVRIVVEDLDRPVQDEIEVGAALPALEQHRAGRDLLLDPIGRHSFRHLGRENRKRLRQPLVGIGLIDHCELGHIAVGHSDLFPHQYPPWAGAWPARGRCPLA